MMRFAATFTVMALLATSALAETRAISFEAGSSSGQVSGSFEGYDSDDLTLNARAGQLLSYELTSKPENAYVNIFRPGDKPGEAEALLIGSIEGATGQVVLPESGNYLLNVHQMRNSARRGDKVDYNLKVSVGDNTLGTDYADGMSGGPDWWQVTGVSGKLNMRQDASTSSRVVMQVGQGDSLRNQGCKMVDGRRWCKVETGSGRSGWVAGDYLREGAAPGSTATEESFDATGMLPCSITLGQPTFGCRFGVNRLDAANGDADITIFWPTESGRMLAFRGGKLDTSGASVERRGDLSVVNFGEERYEIVDAVIFGG